ncbi:WD40 repeat-like protein [Wolfiporia cocos MD-104 SS10]|uniref:WD40 repeat-like protein n=1 Tax=Wolfiporia cocos (strain MD-104) TaxID=742152 RepID=A0A2H3JZJ6_WOLCO|nr:WD40 repeat-like protein [Wolfiporia cocos MD-104 SS10]
MSNPDVPSSVYASQLFRCGEGLPLWTPEPTKFGEVTVGDVGYTHNGGFFRIFNATKEADDSVNREYGVPDPASYKPFLPSQYGSHKLPDAIQAGPLCSKSVSKLSVEASAKVVGASAALQFECNDDQGALLLLKESATREELHPSRRMANYMHHNFQSWVTFARDTLDVDLKDEQIVFVRGWVKTTQWTVAAITHQGRQGKISISGDPGAQASLSFTAAHSHETMNYFAHRSGPPQKTKTDTKGKARTRDSEDVSMADDRSSSHDSYGQEDSESADEPLPLNQCIFLHYYRLKRRRFLGLKKLEAAAEPKDPDDQFDEDDNHIESTPAFQDVKTYDPVGILLDYILEHTEAEAAIANDRDIVQVCKSKDEIPQDFAAFLEEAQPHIEVTEDGLGILSFEGTDIDIAPADAEGDAAQPAGEDRNGAPQEDDALTDAEEEEKKLARQLGNVALEPGVHGDLHRGGVSALAYSSDGRFVASGYEDGTVTIWNPVTRARMFNLEVHTQPICALAFSPDGNKLASGSSDKRVVLWNAPNGIKLLELTGHEGFVDSIAFSPDGQTLASASVDFTARLWNVQTGEQRAVLSGHNAMVMLVAFSPDGTKLLTASADCIARIWSVKTGGEIHSLEGHQGVIYAIDWSPDGRRVLTSSDDGSTRIWQTESGEELVILREHAGSVWHAAFSPDGKRVLSAASDRKIKQCDSFSGEKTLDMDTNEALVSAPWFSNDGELVCAGAEDHSVHVWSTKTGGEIASFEGHTDNITHLRFSPDKTRVVSASDDSSVRIWTLPEALVQAQPAPALV